MPVPIPPDLLVSALHAGATHITALLAGHAGTTLAGMALHQGASTIVGQTLPHILAHISTQHLATAGVNFVTGTASAAAGASSGLGAAWIAGSGAWNAYNYFKDTADIRGGGHGNSSLGKIARFLKKYPWTKLAGGTEESVREAQLLNVLFVLVFARLDEIYASLEHKDIDGKCKTRLAQARVCTSCEECVDFAQSSGSRCECGCQHRQHKAVSWEENFLGPRAGFMLLTCMAESLYEDLKRVGVSEDEESTWLKDDMSTDIEKCKECGCTDFALRPPWNLKVATECVCDHRKEHHKKVSWDDDSAAPEIFMTSLAIVMDSIYQELGHEMLVPSLGDPQCVKKESVFQIRTCVGCVDFNYKDNTNFTRWFMESREVIGRGYCYCGQQWRSHYRPF